MKRGNNVHSNKNKETSNEHLNINELDDNEKGAHFSFIRFFSALCAFYFLYFYFILQSVIFAKSCCCCCCCRVLARGDSPAEAAAATAQIVVHFVLTTTMQSLRTGDNLDSKHINTHTELWTEPNWRSSSSSRRKSVGNIERTISSTIDSEHSGKSKLSATSKQPAS